MVGAFFFFFNSFSFGYAARKFFTRDAFNGIKRPFFNNMFLLKWIIGKQSPLLMAVVLGIIFGGLVFAILVNTDMSNYYLMSILFIQVTYFILEYYEFSIKKVRYFAEEGDGSPRRKKHKGVNDSFTDTQESYLETDFS